MASIANSKKQCVGMWANGVPIYAEEHDFVSHLLEKMPHKTVEPGAGLDAGQIPWLVWGGKLYSKPAEETILREFAAKHLAGVAGADILGSPAIHLLTHGGKQTTEAILHKFFPNHRNEIHAIVEKLSAVLPAHGKTPMMPESHGLAYTGSHQKINARKDAWYTGGCGCTGAYVGSGQMSLDNLAEYKGTLNSAMKDKIMDAAVSAASAMGIAVSGSSRDEKIESVIRGLNAAAGKNYKMETFTKICAGIAGALNTAYGETIVDTSMPAAAMCQQISEFLVSLVAGIRAEFLAVYTDVRRIVQNLLILRSSLREMDEDTVKFVEKIEDPVIRRHLNQYDELKELISEETERQIGMLENLLNVHLAPNEQILAEMLRSADSYKSFISKIEKGPGGASKSQFTKVISQILNGQAVTLSSARLAEKQLQLLGISIEEYRKLDTVEKFRGRVAEILSKADLNDPKTQQLVGAAKMLSNTYSQQDNYLEKLDGAKAGSAEGFGDVPSLKKMRTREVMQQLVFDGFAKQISSLFDTFVDSLDELSKHIGSVIPVSTELEKFMDDLESLGLELDLSQKKNTYFALVGFYKDAKSKEIKDKFLRDTRVLEHHLDSLMAKPENSKGLALFRAVRTVLESMTNLVSRYSNDVAEKFGREEGYDGYDGGAEGDLLKGFGRLVEGLPKVTIRRQKEVSDIVNQANFRFRVAQIRENMKSQRGEIEVYNEKYTDMVTKTIASKLSDLAEKQKDITDKLGLIKTGKVGGAKFYEAGLLPAFASEDAAKKTVEETIKLVDKMFTVKKQFWMTVEAVDAYMRVFSDAIITHPEDVKEIKSMLDGVDVIVDWYNESTGDDVAAFFDTFPSTYDSTKHGLETGGATNADATGLGDHYYDKIIAPGNPYLAWTPEQGVPIYEKAKSIFNSLMVFKNLLNAFINIGRQFGDVEIHKKIFMTPNQIYTSLVDFIAASSLLIGVGSDKRRLSDAATGHAEAIAADTNIMKPYGVSAALCTGNPEDMDGPKVSFKEEREYFVMIMKCLAAKILTVTGTYEVFNHSDVEYLSLRPVRMILGAADSTPKVENEAVELYLRLPLLAGYYKELFGWLDDERPEYTARDIPRKNKRVKITMVPDIDGVFSGLINIIFRKTDKIESANFNDDEIRDIIREVNTIYQKLKSAHSSDLTRGIVREFVKEVNRRFSIVSDVEHEKYEVLRGELYDYQRNYAEDNNRSEYAILPGEEDVSLLGEKMVRSPAAKLAGIKTGYDPLLTDDSKHDKYSLSSDYSKIVHEFRARIDKVADASSAATNKDITFRPAIRHAQAELRTASDDEKRFRIIARLIRGNDNDFRVNGANCIALHETVVTGLNLLSGIHSMLVRFKNTMTAIDLDLIAKRLRNPTDYARPGMVMPLTTRDEKTAAIVAELNQLQIDVPGSLYIKSIVDTILTKVVVDAAAPMANYTGPKKIDSLGKHIHVRRVLHIMLETIMGVNQGSDGLINVIFDAGRFQINYGRLRELIEDTFKSVADALDVMRPHFTKNELLKYTDKKTTGSFYWLQEQLLHKIILGRPASPKGANAPLVGESTRAYETLEKIGLRITNTYTILITLANLNPGVESDGTSNDRHALLWRHLISVADPRDLSGTVMRNVAPVMSDIIHNPYDELLFHHDGKNKIADLRVVPRFEAFYSWKEDLSVNRSIVVMFNQLIAKFIQSFYDPMTSKMYQGLIAPFASHFTRAITNIEFTYPDVTPAMYMDARDPISYLESSVVIRNTLESLHIGALAASYMDLTIPMTVGDLDARHAAAMAGAASVAAATNAAIVSVIRDWLLELFDKYDAAIPTHIAFHNRFNLIHDAAAVATVGNRAAAKVITDALDVNVAFAAVDADARLPIIDWVRNNMTPGNAGNQQSELKPISDTTTLQSVFPDAASMAVWFALWFARELRKQLTVYVDTATTTPAGAVVAATDYTLIPAPAAAALLPTKNTPFGGGGAGAAARCTYIQFLSALAEITGIAAGAPVTPGHIVAGVTLTAAAREIAILIYRSNPAITSMCGLVYNMYEAAGAAALGAAPTVAQFDAQTGVNTFTPTYTSLTTIDTERARKEPFKLSLVPGLMVQYIKTVYPYSGTGSNEYQKRLWVMTVLHSFYIWVPFFTNTTFNTLPQKTGVSDWMSKNIQQYRSLMDAKKVYNPIDTTKMEYLIDYDTYRSADISSPESDENKATPTIPHVLFARSDAIVKGAANTIYELGYLNPGGNHHNAKADVLKFSQKVDADATHILFSSLAARIGNLVRPAITAEKSHLYDNVADIPSYIKEKIRANAPIFVQLLRALIRRAKTLGQFLGTSEFEVVIVPATSNKYRAWPYSIPRIVDDAKENTRRFIGILDAVIAGASTLITGCEQTLREIGDDPKFLESQQHSLREYKANNNIDPFTPLSSALFVLNNQEDYSNSRMLPIYSLGDDRFKLAYGTRALLNRPGVAPSLALVPGFKEIVERFNLSSNSSKFSAEKIESMAKNYITALRFINELKNYNGAMSGFFELGKDNLEKVTGPFASPLSGNIVRHDLVFSTLEDMSAVTVDIMTPKRLYNAESNRTTASIIPISGTVVAFPRITANKDKFNGPAAFALQNSLSGVLELTESSFHDNVIRQFVKLICGDGIGLASSRYVHNVLDLGIVPINVHALRREIPLVNIYNYAYTYDRMILEMYHHVTGNAMHDTSTFKYAKGPIDDPNRALAALLYDPYIPIHNNFAKMIAEVENLRGGGGGGDPKATRRLFSKAVTDTGGSQYLAAAVGNAAQVLHTGGNIAAAIAAANATIYAAGEQAYRDMLAGMPVDAEFSRPKFLSDQLLGKALIDPLYDGALDNTGHAKVPRAFKMYVSEHSGLNLATLSGQNQLADMLKTQYAKVAAIAADAGAKARVLALDIRMDQQPPLVLDITATTTEIWYRCIQASIMYAVYTISQEYLRGIASADYKALLSTVRNRIRTFSAAVQAATLADAMNAAAVPAEMQPYLGVANALGNGTPKAATDADIDLTLVKEWSVIKKNLAAEYGKSGVTKTDGTAVAATVIPATISDARHISVLNRTLIFIVNLQRSVRAKLHTDLMRIPRTSKIISSLPITSTTTTEFYGYQKLKKR